MFELATCAEVRFKSVLMVTVNWKGKGSAAGCHHLGIWEHITKGGKVYQAQKANIKPSHEKKKTRPWGSMGLKTGTLRAFLVTGLRTGRRQRSDALSPILLDCWVTRGMDGRVARSQAWDGW